MAILSAHGALHRGYAIGGGHPLYVVPRVVAGHQCGLHGGVAGGYALWAHLPAQCHVSRGAVCRKVFSCAPFYRSDAVHGLLRGRILGMLASVGYTVCLPFGNVAFVAKVAKNLFESAL